MKFFKSFIKHKIYFNKPTHNSQRYNTPTFGQCDLVAKFNGFLLKGGSATKHKLYISTIFKNLNHFIYFNRVYLITRYPLITSTITEIFNKRLNCLHIFNLVVDLIKLPFIVKSLAVPKKLRKKTKQKYIIKINYRDENKRIAYSLKQLSYYSNKFQDNRFKFRLYKAITLSFFE